VPGELVVLRDRCECDLRHAKLAALLFAETRVPKDTLDFPGAFLIKRGATEAGS
jgi:hypothetical protein